MDGSIAQTYLSDILHVVAQSLLAPDIILLLVLIGYALFCIGSVVAELFSERRHFNVTMPGFLADLMAAQEDELPQVISQSGLLNRQKLALLTVYDYRMLPGDSMVALIRRLVNEEETRYDRITDRNNMAARIAPMLGLMGTLIPLGPGIQALGNADTAALSSSLLVAFDTTVAGLVAAAVCLVVGKIRSNWYGNYMSALDSAMATMLQKIEDMREAGLIQIQEPTDYAFLFEKQMGNKGAKKPTKRQRKADGLDQPQPQEASMPLDESGFNAVPAQAAIAGAALNDNAADANDAYAAPAFDPNAAFDYSQVPEPFANAGAYEAVQQPYSEAGDAYPSDSFAAVTAGAPFDQIDQVGQPAQFGQFEAAPQADQFDQFATTGPLYTASEPQSFQEQPFDQQPTGGLPAVDPVAQDEAAPFIPEIPMPSFLDDLASAQEPAPEPAFMATPSFDANVADIPAIDLGPTAEPATESGGTDAFSAPTLDLPSFSTQFSPEADQPASNWYQPQAFASELPEIPLPTWEFGQTTGPIDPVQQPEE